MNKERKSDEYEMMMGRGKGIWEAKTTVVRDTESVSWPEKGKGHTIGAFPRWPRDGRDGRTKWISNSTAVLPLRRIEYSTWNEPLNLKECFVDFSVVARGHARLQLHKTQCAPCRECESTACAKGGPRVWIFPGRRRIDYLGCEICHIAALL